MSEFYDTSLTPVRPASRLTNIRYPIGSIIIADADASYWGLDYRFLKNRPLVVVSNQTQMFDSLTVCICTSRDRPGIQVSLWDYSTGKWNGDKQYTVVEPYSVQNIRIRWIKTFLGVVDPFTMKAIQEAMSYHLGLSDKVPPYMEEVHNTFYKPLYNNATIQNTQLGNPYAPISAADSMNSYGVKVPIHRIGNTGVDMNLKAQVTNMAPTGKVSELVFPGIDEARDENSNPEILASADDEEPIETGNNAVDEGEEEASNFVDFTVIKYCSDGLTISEGMRIAKDAVYDGYRFFVNRSHMVMQPRDRFERYLRRNLGPTIDGEDPDYWYGINLSKGLCEILNANYNNILATNRRNSVSTNQTSDDFKPTTKKDLIEDQHDSLATKTEAGEESPISKETTPRKKRSEIVHDLPQEIVDYIKKNVAPSVKKSDIDYADIRQLCDEKAEELNLEIPTKRLFFSAFKKLFPASTNIQRSHNGRNRLVYTNVKWINNSEGAKRYLVEKDSTATANKKSETVSDKEVVPNFAQTVDTLTDAQKIAIVTNTYHEKASWFEAVESNDPLAFSKLIADGYLHEILIGYQSFINKEYIARIGSRVSNFKFLSDVDKAVFIFYTDLDRLYVKPVHMKNSIKDFCRHFSIDLSNDSIRRRAVSYRTLSEMYGWPVK